MQHDLTILLVTGKICDVVYLNVTGEHFASICPTVSCSVNMHNGLFTLDPFSVAQLSAQEVMEIFNLMSWYAADADET